MRVFCTGKMQRFAIFLLLGVFTSSCQFFSSNKFDRQLEKKGFRMNEGWGIFKPFEGLESDHPQIQTYKNSKDEILRIVFFDNISRQEAFQLAKNRSLTIVGLFATKDAPYLGKISATESCLSKNKVDSTIENLSDGFFLRYSLMANSNFVYGSCSEKEDIFRSFYLVRYCESSRTLAEAKIFVGLDQEFSNQNFNLECVN